MPWITIVMSMAGAASLILAVAHGRIWYHWRTSWENLLLAVACAAAGAAAMTELSMLHARTAAEYRDLLRWLHVPVAVLAITLAWLIVIHLRAGRAWLAWLITGLRGLVLVANFSLPNGATFSEITGVHTLDILGETLTTPEGVASPWRLLANLSGLLLLVHALDAGLAARKRRTRPRPLLFGGVIAAASLLATVASNLMVQGVLPAPFISLSFLVIVVVVGWELSADLVNANQLSRDLSESQARMQLAADAANLVLWNWDFRRDEMWIAGATQSAIGPTPGQAMSLEAFLQSVHPDDRDATREALLRMTDGDGRLEAEYRRAGGEGASRWIAVRGTVERDASGRPLILRGASRDITEQKRVEAELERQRSDLAHVQRVSTVEQLSSALSHELNQPLGAILRNAEAADLLLRRDAPDLEEIRAIVRDILQDDRRAAAVTNRMRALLQRRDLAFERVEVGPLIRQVATFLEPEFRMRHATLRTQSDPDLPHASGDRVHLQQVILNLLLNALDAVEGQPAERQEIVVRASEAANAMIEVAVIDRGVGVPPAHLPRLFDSFFTSKPAGTGLGLAISKTIVEAHGGRIWAEHDPGGGLTVRFTIKAVLPGATA
jgi:PAS domain S-box-containing protein